MTTIIRRLPALTLIGVMLLCFIYGSSVPARQTIAANLQATTAAASAAGPAATVAGTVAGTSAAAALPSTRPVVQGNLNGTQLSQGIPGSYCWPDASPQCDFQDDPQPTASVSVNTGDAIAFSVAPASPAPSDLRGLLLDDKGSDGALKIVDLTSTNNSFTVDSSLANGPHRLEVDAIYGGSIQGNKPFVSTVYLLTIGAVQAVGTAGGQTGTEAVASVITATSAGAATTEQAATSAAVASTAQATTETPAATTAVTVATTAAATVAVTVEAPTATETQPVVVSVSTVEPTTEVTTAATTEPTTATTVAPSPTATETPVPPTPTLEPTIEPTIEPTATATLEPTSETNTSGTSGPVVVTVVVTSVASGATLAPISTAQVPPSQFIVEGHRYSYIAVNACATGDGGATLCVNRPVDSNAPRITALPNDAALIEFQGPRPTGVQVVIYTSDGVKVIKRDTLQPDNLMLYTLPSTPGNYVVTTEITYPAGKVTYYYRVQILG